MEGSCHLKRFLRATERLNPLRWSKRTVKVVAAGFFAIFLPLYLFYGFQPVNEVDAANYPLFQAGAINLESPVKPVSVYDHQLEVPNTIIGSYSIYANKILLVGHSSTIFRNLHQINLGDQFVYDSETYHVTKIETLEKSAISMNDVLTDSEVKTLILMTCAGQPLPNQDATHRLLVTAEISQ